MSHSPTTECEPQSTSTLPEHPGVLVAKKHHLLVRWSHWLNVPILLGLILSGISIYNHMSLGPGMLALALRLHWLCAYSFMLNGMVYFAGLVMGGGWRSLLPRRTDLFDALKMFRYYVGLPFAKLIQHKWPHPRFDTKYNALQRAAYFSIPVAGFLSVATGWAIHKPMQLHWLAALFGGFDAARVWHFWLMWLFIFFLVPHVILVLADGWDTLRSMIVGWSRRVKRSEFIANEQ